MNKITKCHSCEIQAKREAGESITRAESNHWMLWGCTCDTNSAAAAVEYLRLVTQ